ncbi:hypothetical protein KFE80_05240 [bacterium SCSIO 12696]|nr:hypothetical protein KFE80_05240 [bacterium SCSIO 12696]
MKKHKKYLLLASVIGVICFGMYQATKKRVMVHPTEPMVLSLPSAFSICARSFGLMYATDGDPSYWFPDDCVQTSLGSLQKEPQEIREVTLHIKRQSSEFATWAPDWGVKTKLVAGIEVLFFETSKVNEIGAPLSRRSLSIEFEAEDGWVQFLADGVSEDGQVADLSFAWEAFETYVKQYHAAD